jgi:hypothetical protein
MLVRFELAAEISEILPLPTDSSKSYFVLLGLRFINA